MRIAQISPLTEAVPPKLYGGTERVISWLTEELVALGHEVTLFASGDSATRARLDTRGIIVMRGETSSCFLLETGRQAAADRRAGQRCDLNDGL